MANSTTGAARLPYGSTLPRVGLMLLGTLAAGCGSDHMAQVVRPPRFNAHYDVEDVKPVDFATWKLEFAMTF